MMANLLYYLVYGFFYLVSLLPWFVVYALSSGIAFLLQHVIGYRRKIISESIQRSFPEKSAEEISSIRNSFYTNFCDTWLEMIKILSMSSGQLNKMVSSNLNVLHDLYGKYPHVQIFSGHYMNWELYQAALTLNQPYEIRGIYMPVHNKVFNRLVYHIRSKFGIQLISATDSQKLAARLRPLPETTFASGVVADQSPPNLNNARWLNFLHQPTAFMLRPWERMKLLAQPVVFLSPRKPARGRYYFEAILMTEHPEDFTATELLLKYAALVEGSIIADPAVYLWSHRRWKLRYQPELHQQEWISPNPPEAA